MLLFFFHNTRSRLKAKNVMYIKQILFAIEGLVRALGGECVLSSNDFFDYGLLPVCTTDCVAF